MMSHFREGREMLLASARRVHLNILWVIPLLALTGAACGETATSSAEPAGPTATFSYHTATPATPTPTVHIPTATSLAPTPSPPTATSSSPTPSPPTVAPPSPTPTFPPLTTTPSSSTPTLPPSTATSLTPHPTNTPSPTILDDAPLPTEFTGGEGILATRSLGHMMAVGEDGLSGYLDLIQLAAPYKTKIIITLDDAGSGPYSAALRRGSCPDEGKEPTGKFDYLLFDIEDGESVSLIDAPAQFFQFALSYVAVVGGTDLGNDPLISCGNIPSPLR